MLVAALGVVLASSVMSCERAQEDETPTQAVEAFIELVAQAEGTVSPDLGVTLEPPESAMRELAARLDQASREALVQRARQAEALAHGARYEGWQMLVPGRFRLRFEPVGFRETIEGNRATVTVRGRRTHALVPLVREGGTWKIALGLDTLHSEPIPFVRVER